MTITNTVVKDIIKKLLHGDDYRIEIVNLINAEFLEFTVEFFKRIVEARLKNQSVTSDWYKQEFLNPKTASPDEIAIYSGLNMKTISNIYNSAKKEIVIDASQQHYQELYDTINNLIETNGDVDITLTIKFRGVSVDLNMNESLIVINTLAVKRSALRGGLWSTAGKQVEKPLMMTLCQLFNVPAKHYNLIQKPDSLREVDFYLIGQDSRQYRCEVKLMGKGNPESADAVIARDTHVFVADKLSDLNKQQLTNLKIEWVELRTENGYKRFFTVLSNLNIPCRDFTGDTDLLLDNIFHDFL